MLYLIDTSIYVFRAWQTFPPDLVNSHGEQANAQIGFAHTLADILTRPSPDLPDHAVCAFDECLRSGIRHQLYPAYKADRPPAPDELRVQFRRCRQVAEAFGIACYGSSRVEADDIIGRFAHLAQQAAMPVTIISADKDLAQYIGPLDTYWDYARSRRLGTNDIYRRFRVRPEQIPDWLALCGDKSDNIPGIPGVGEATAARLLRRFDDLDALFAQTGQVASMGFRGAPRISELLPQYESQVRLARQLTGLIADDTLPDSLTPLGWRRRSEAAMRAGLAATGLDATTAASLAGQVAGRAVDQPAATDHVDLQPS